MDLGLVCDGCGAFNELGVGSCGSCSASLSLDTVDGRSAELFEPPPLEEATQARDYGAGISDFDDDEPTDSGSPPGPQACGTCGAIISGGNRFCGACGTPIGASLPAIAPKKAKKSGSSKKTLFFSSIQAAKAKLVLIKGEGNDGESYSLAGEDHRIGRNNADIVFQEDEFLSPIHANFFYVEGKLVVSDEESTNGVYLRIHGDFPLQDKDYFLVGEQVIQVCKLGDDPGLKATEDGTYLYASPRRPAKFDLRQVLHGGAEGMKHPALNDAISLGREDNDMNFPDDPFISGHHAKVSQESEVLTLSDLGSKNGTFVRITKPTPLSHGDYVFMGQQLLRVEIV